MSMVVTVILLAAIGVVIGLIVAIAVDPMSGKSGIAERTAPPAVGMTLERSAMEAEGSLAKASDAAYATHMVSRSSKIPDSSTRPSKLASRSRGSKSSKTHEK